jgi:hypothetical protein
MPRRKPGRFPILAVAAAFLAIVFLQLLRMANMNPATLDEPDLPYSAYVQATLGDFGLNPEDPPLTKYIGALGLLNM